MEKVKLTEETVEKKWPKSPFLPIYKEIVRCTQGLTCPGAFRLDDGQARYFFALCREHHPAMVLCESLVAVYHASGVTEKCRHLEAITGLHITVHMGQFKGLLITVDRVGEEFDTQQPHLDNIPRITDFQVNHGWHDPLDDFDDWSLRYLS